MTNRTSLTEADGYLVDAELSRRRARLLEPNPVAVRRAVLGVPRAFVDAGSVQRFALQPLSFFRPTRFVVEQEHAEHFQISDIRVGNVSALLSPVPATLFPPMPPLAYCVEHEDCLQNEGLSDACLESRIGKEGLARMRRLRKEWEAVKIDFPTARASQVVSVDVRSHHPTDALPFQAAFWGQEIYS